MKLKFQKNDDGNIKILVGDKIFSTKFYIEMIKEIKNEENIEAEFSENISEEEKKEVNAMLAKINNIRENDTSEETDDNEEIDDLPF